MTRTMKFGLLASLFCLANAAQAYADAVYAAPPTSTSCTLPWEYGGPLGGGPGPNQAFLWTGTYTTGTCYVLTMDGRAETWTSWDATTGFPNDAIQSVVVGTSVNLVLFWNNFYTQDGGATKNITSFQYAPDLGTWNNRASAARLQTFSPGSCGGTSNRVVIFTDIDAGDCTEYRSDIISCFTDPIAMGFRNDTLSSVRNTSTSAYAFLYGNVGWGDGYYQISPNTPTTYVGSYYNDRISCMGVNNNQCFRI
jgi:hypothetical protein